MNLAGPVDDDEVNLTRSAEAEARERIADEDNEQKAKDKQASPKAHHDHDGHDAHGPAQAPKSSFKPKYGSRHGIYDEDNYLRVKGLYKIDPRSGQKVPDTDKLRVALLAAIEDKGWTEGIAIYRKNRIDQTLTSAAQSLLASDTVLLLAMQKRGVSGISCQQSLDPDNPPCWLCSEREIKGHKNRAEKEWRQNVKAKVTSLKEAERKLKGFEKDADGNTIKDELRKYRKELESQVPGVTRRAFNAASNYLQKTEMVSATGLGAGTAAAAATGASSAGPAAPAPPSA